jgi:hypothetical protein
MRHGLLGSIVALVASAGVTFAQKPTAVDPINAPTAGHATAVSPLPISQASSIYEPLNVSSPPAPAAAPADSPAWTAFGPGSDAGYDGNSHGFRRYWVSGDYLLWSVKNGGERWPLIISGTIISGATPGAPGTEVLFAGSPFDFGGISGARASAGGYLPGSSRFGVEAMGLILPTRTISNSAATGPLGFPVLGTPFINDLTGGFDSVNAGSPGNPGSIFASASTMLWTAEIDLFANLVRTPYFSANVITGFRHFNLAEGFFLQQNRTIGSTGQTFQGVPLPLGSRTLVVDDFETTNRFYGWQFGFDFEYRFRCWSFDLGLHSAIGNMHEAVQVSGFSQATIPVVVNNVPGTVTSRATGGVLAQTTNIGRRLDDEFAVVPEVTADVGYQITHAIRFQVGYSFLYASNVVRPGEQIDPRVNPTLVPTRPEFGLPLGSNRPMQIFSKTDFWAVGVNFGVTIMY